MGWMLILLARLVLSGWAFHIPALTSVVPGLVTMKPNTAAAFLLTGVALLRRNRRDLTVYALGVLVSQFGCDLQSLSHSLHSSTLENLGLVAGMKGLCQEFPEQQGVQVDFAHKNVLRGISGDAALWKVHLAVFDRGKGFDAKKSLAKRIGIRSMRNGCGLSKVGWRFNQGPGRELELRRGFPSESLPAKG
jgi:hypothetical protein